MLYSPPVIDVKSNRIVQALRRSGLGNLAAGLLGAGGPLPFLGAQALYFGAPVLDPLLGAFNAGEAADLARLLEDPAATQALARSLAEDARS